MRAASHLVVSACVVACAWAVAAQVPPSPPASAQTAAAPAQGGGPFVFEVSTVKVSKSGESGSGSSMHNGTFRANNVQVKSLMQYQAYGIPEQRILGAPKWLDTVRFDIEAKPESSVAEALQKFGPEQRHIQIQAMFQQLLAERFKLVVHWETRELPIYDLVTAKNGPTLQKTTSKEGESDVSSNTGRLTAKGVTLEELCKVLTSDLGRDIGRVVVDHSGITGRYDVAIKWTPEAGTAAAGSGTENSAPAADAGPSIFAALQEQLGLKLESAKGPIQVLVIDHVEMPQEN